MPLPLTASCFNKIQIGFTFLVLAHPGSPGQRAVKRVYVCVYVYLNGYLDRNVNKQSLINSAVFLHNKQNAVIKICRGSSISNWVTMTYSKSNEILKCYS